MPIPKALKYKNERQFKKSRKPKNDLSISVFISFSLICRSNFIFMIFFNTKAMNDDNKQKKRC